MNMVVRLLIYTAERKNKLCLHNYVPMCKFMSCDVIRHKTSEINRAFCLNIPQLKRNIDYSYNICGIYL